MLLPKNNKLFRIRYLQRDETDREVYNLTSLRGKFGSKARSDIEVIEYDVVEVGCIAFNDLAEYIKRS